MKMMKFAILAAAMMGVAGTAVQAAPHHRHQVCTWKVVHHHKVKSCHWR
ncbi:MAG: hypothetical protein ACTHOJ_15825 [Sphingomonas oligoaromativorans]